MSRTMRNPKIDNSTKRSKTRPTEILPKGNFKIEDNECHIVVRVYDNSCCTAYIETRGMLVCNFSLLEIILP